MGLVIVEDAGSTFVMTDAMRVGRTSDATLIVRDGGAASAGSVRIGIAIFSYAGQIGFGVTGDYESVPDLDVLAAGIEAGVEDLLMAS